MSRGGGDGIGGRDEAGNGIAERETGEVGGVGYCGRW